jgi:hypothetical protein
MKKVFVALLVIGFLAAVAAAPAWAQEKKISFSLNAGVQTNVFQGTSFDKAWFAPDARLGILLGRSFEISPEVMAVFMSGGTMVYPGVMLNYRIGGFFLGAGAVLPWAISSDGESDTGNLAPKINIGYRFGKFQVTAYMIAWTESGIDFLDLNYIGASLGYRF